MRVRGQELRPVAAVAGAGGSALRADAGTPGSGFGFAGAAGVLGQAVVSRLSSAGLDVDFALMLVHDGPAADRLRHAVDELDEAIASLRRLMLAVPGVIPDAGARGADGEQDPAGAPAADG